MLLKCIDIFYICYNIAYMNTNILYTKHAAQRCEQRGISNQAIDIILNYGHFDYVRGAKTWFMNRQEKAYAKADLGSSYKKIEKKLGYLVVSHEGVLITAGHSYKRLRNKS